MIAHLRIIQQEAYHFPGTKKGPILRLMSE